MPPAAALDAQERARLAAWLRLTTTPGVGAASGRRLLAAFAAPEAVFAAAPQALSAVVGERLAFALAQPPVHAARLLERTLAWLEGGAPAAGRHWLALGDAAYPSALLHTPDPPLLLYVEGDLAALAHPRAVALVGSRNPTPQGADNARAFAAALGQAGCCIVSGLALGIDAAAHQGALDAGAPTVAVLGTGLDRVYPRGNQELAQRILAQGGAWVSEYALGTPPLAPNFPQRNRIIAGLTQGTLVLEAALESGSLITAELATQYGREVFAMPGSIHSAQSRGCHALIRQGAKLVESVHDVLEELEGTAATATSAAPRRAPQRQAQQASLAWEADAGASAPAGPGSAGTDTQAPSPASPASGATAALLHALGYDPVGLDALQARTGWTTPQLQAALLELELAGRVQRLSGGLFQRVERA